MVLIGLSTCSIRGTLVTSASQQRALYHHWISLVGLSNLHNEYWSRKLSPKVCHTADKQAPPPLCRLPWEILSYTPSLSHRNPPHHTIKTVSVFIHNASVLVAFIWLSISPTFSCEKMSNWPLCCDTQKFQLLLLLLLLPYPQNIWHTEWTLTSNRYYNLFSGIGTLLGKKERGGRGEHYLELSWREVGQFGHKQKHVKFYRGNFKDFATWGRILKGVYPAVSQQCTQSTCKHRSQPFKATRCTLSITSSNYCTIKFHCFYE